MLRPYQHTDFDALLRILNAPGGHAITRPDSIQQQLESNRVLISEEDGQIRGFAFLEVGKRISQVILYVDPTRRGQGLGTCLWNAALEALAETDPSTLWVFYRQDIGIAREFYARRGCQVWYSYYQMQYTGPAFPDSGLEWRLYNEEDFERYYPARNAAFFELEKSIGSHGYHEDHRERIRTWAKENKEDLYLFFDQGELVGSLAIIDKSFLDEVFVCPGAQRSGWGRKMVQFAVNRILARGLQPELVAVTTNTRAKALYDSCGFVTVKTLEMARKFKPGVDPDYTIPG